MQLRQKSQSNKAPLRAKFAWRGEERLRGESNYFIGRDPKRWRTQVPHFAEAEADHALPGLNVTIYGSDDGMEYDLKLAPGCAPGQLRLRFSGKSAMRIAPNGDLVLTAGRNEVRMKSPRIYEDSGPPDSAAGEAQIDRNAQSSRRSVEGSYVLEGDGTVGFRVGTYDARKSLVIDPSISVDYATFLGGSGNDAATSVSLDGSGDVYIGGTTTAPATFAEAGSRTLGPGIAASGGSGPNGNPSEYFVAKIDSHVTGLNSLVYLTFLGGSVNQTGGILSVDASGDVAITGTTSSPDFPVTDGSVLTTGLNDTTVTEVDPTGSKLLFSTLFGGNGAESLYGNGGIALDTEGNIYVASDTSSTDLPVTTGAFQTILTGRTADGFLAVFQPASVPNLIYCSYLGTNANVQVGVGGIAVDPASNVYIAGFTSNAENSFPAKNAFQSVYAGDPADAFLMKIQPAGLGAADLIYATLLGGSGEDEATAVALDSSVPPIAYVTGTTQSPDFPVHGSNAAFQPTLHTNATANAFLAAVAQNPATGMTSLAYSTYLGGSATDIAQGVAVAALNAVFVVGTTSSWDFPWRDNLQPFNGSNDAFVAKLDPTMAGTASLIYATPLGGTAPTGAAVNAVASAAAADRSGNLFVAGETTAADFPTAITTASIISGAQSVCGSCQESPPLADAFLVALQENAAQEPSVYFNVGRVVFPSQPVGGQNAPQPVAVHNGGESLLHIAGVTLSGPNSQDFSLVGGSACQGQSIPPGGECSFEVNFTPSIAAAEGAVVSFTDDAPGSPQVLELSGQGQGPFASLSSTSLNFGSQPENTASLAQTITITNTGNEALSMGSPTESGPDVAQFFLSGKDITCGTSVLPGQSCSIAVVFEPQSVGSFTAQINVSDDSGGLANAEQVINLSGTGTAPAPVASVTPVNLSFGEIELGSTSGVQTVTLINSGSIALNISAIGISGANAADFSLDSPGSTPCPLGAGTVAAGKSCVIGIEFLPQSGDPAGAKAASLSISDNSAGSPQTVALSGTATVLPTIQISPATLDFPAQSVGIASAGQTVTLWNSSSTSLSINGVSVTGANAMDFIETNNCPPSLNAGAKCILNVAFDPRSGAPATRSAVVKVADNAASSPQTISVSGTATQAGVGLSPASLNFGSQLAGTASAPETITVTDSGNGSLAFGAVTVTGPDFTIWANSCRATTTPAGGVCTIQLSFSPACTNGAAARSATLVLNDNAPGSPQTVALSGTATGDFCFALAPAGSASVAVAAGVTAAYSLVVNSPTGYKGSVELSCSGAPMESSCVIPASITVPSQVGVTVPTTASSAASLVQAFPTGFPPGLRGLVFVFIVVLCLCVAARVVVQHPASMRDSRMELWRSVRAGILLTAFTLTMTSCSNRGGGNDAGTSANPGTPAGTYALTVAGTSANTSAKIALSLTVN
jgi:HYDIN/CFA65/VesB-like, Ig-like domain/Beta-propeller repeat